MCWSARPAGRPGQSRPDAAWRASAFRRVGIPQCCESIPAGGICGQDTHRGYAVVQLAGEQQPGHLIEREPGLHQMRRERVAQARSQKAPPKSQGGERAARAGIGQFVRECIAELRKVQWPTRVQLWQATGVVIIVCIVIGVYIAALDAVLFRASRWLINEYAAH